MPRFTINDIEKMTGIKAHTLRVWEQRYLVQPARRKESGHRYYDEEDLKHLLRLAMLYRSGHKISTLASLQEEEIRILVRQLEAKKPQEAAVWDLVRYSLSFDQEGLGSLLDSLVGQHGLEETFFRFIDPFLDLMRTLWLTDRATPAQQHFASQLIRHAIIAATEAIEKASVPPPPELLLFTSVSDPQEMLLLFMAYLLRRNRYSFLYLGAQVEPALVLEFLQQYAVKGILIPVSTPLATDPLENLLHAVTNRYPQIDIVLAGNPEILEQVEEIPCRRLNGQAEITAYCKQPLP